MKKVFFYEAFQEEEEAIKRYLPKKLKADFTWKTIQAAGHKTPPAEIISTRTQSIIPGEWAGKMKALLSRSTGYDHLKAYREQNDEHLVCGYLPLYCNRSVAEQALLLWLALIRKLNVQQKQFDRFHRDNLTGYELQYRHLVVVGVGNIGYEVVRIGRGLDMEVTGVDIDKKHEDVKYRSIDDVISEADIIVCAMNLTADNVNYFNYERLNKVKPGTIFINIARGEMSPSADLLRLLQEGILGGVGLDVYNQESILAEALRSNTQNKSDDPEVKAVLQLRQSDNVILTPHNAFNTSEAVERKAAQSVEQIEEFEKQGTFRWNVP